MSEARVVTNNVPRATIQGYELTEKEQKEFDYLTWDEENGTGHIASFFRYKGNLYHLGDAMAVRADHLPADSVLKGWHGYYGESYFSAVLVRYTNDYESVVVGQMFS